MTREEAVSILEKEIISEEEVRKLFDYEKDIQDILEYIEAMKMAIKAISKQRTGRWKWVQYDGNPKIGNWHCSECRTIIPHMPEETDNTPIYKWCPMCGAKMEA